MRLWCGRKPDFRVKLIPYFRFLAKGDGRSYLAMESPFIATVYHTTYHFGLYLYQFLYQFLYQLFLRCISPYPPYNTNFFCRLCHMRNALSARRKRRRWNVHLRLFCDPGCVVQLMVGISSRGRKQGCKQPCRNRPGLLVELSAEVTCRYERSWTRSLGMLLVLPICTLRF